MNDTQKQTEANLNEAEAALRRIIAVIAHEADKRLERKRPNFEHAAARVLDEAYTALDAVKAAKRA